MQIEHEGYIIENDKYGHYNVRQDGRGTVVSHLRGSFTTVLKAIQAIDHTIAVKQTKKGRKDELSNTTD